MSKCRKRNLCTTIFDELSIYLLRGYKSRRRECFFKGIKNLFLFDFSKFLFINIHPAIFVTIKTCCARREKIQRVKNFFTALQASQKLLLELFIGATRDYNYLFYAQELLHEVRHFTIHRSFALGECAVKVKNNYLFFFKIHPLSFNRLLHISIICGKIANR